MPLSKEQLKQLRQLLLTERARLVGELKSITQDASQSPRDAAGDLSGYAVHMADMATDTHERELSMNIASTEQSIIYQIDDALKRLDDGTYGICESCSEPIAMNRLKAVPQATMCIECQRQKEHKEKR